ncbi:MAG: hypothetical protein V4520_02525 [Bacteroidota bacterium]
MKYLFLILTLISTNIFAQKAKKKTATKPVSNKIDFNKFLGVGIFKMGSDTTELISYADTHTEFIRNTNSVMRYIDFKMMNDDKGGVNGLIRLKKNVGDETVRLSKNPEVDEFYLTKYEVAGIKLENLKLKYFKGRLVDFTCDDNDDLVDALTQKYGKPKLVTTKKQCQCLYSLTGITRQLEEVTYIQSWENGSLVGYSYLNKGYDKNCKEEYFRYFSVNVNVPILNKWEETHPDYGNDKPKKDLKDL